MVVTNSSECSSEKSESINITTSSKEAFGDEVHIYPNPFSKEFYIEYTISNQADIQILDFTGKEIFRKKEKKSAMININMEDEANGLYLVKITSKEFYSSE